MEIGVGEAKNVIKERDKRKRKKFCGRECYEIP